MKILFTISGMSVSSGGPTACLFNLVQGLKKNCDRVDVLTFEPKNSNSNKSNDEFILEVKRPFESRYGYSSLFIKELQKHKSSDIIHSNGLWQFTTHASSVFARRNNIPHIISTHGMLYPEALKISAMFKKIALTLYQRYDLERATVIHATCIQEKDYIRELGFINPIALIPNSIDINIPAKIRNFQNSKKQIGFIGRFAPIKNLEILIHAWSEIAKSKSDWELVLIGDGEEKYTQELINLVNKLKIENIRFTGFLFGDDKEIALQSLYYLVLPSKSENFGMVVPEALIREIPVIASQGTPWEELQSCDAGWWIGLGIEPLKTALESAMTNSSERFVEMGKNGRKLIIKNYSIESTANKMKELYDWILTDSNKPDFIY